MRARRRDRQPRPFSLRGFVVLPLIVISAIALGAFTASANFSSGAGHKLDTTRAIAVGNLLPARCASLPTIHTIVDTFGTTLKRDPGQPNYKDQIVVGNDTDTAIEGKNGSDCLLPGGNPGPGVKIVNGGPSTDFCYMGPDPLGRYNFFTNHCENWPDTPPPPYVSVATS